ncbi:MAG: MFS transporter [Bacteroidales bacterium]
MIKKYLKISVSEEKAFVLHLAYSVIDGLILGLFALNEFILIKSLKGSNYEIGFLFQFTILVLLLSIIIDEFFKKLKNKKSLIRYVGIITRLPLVCFTFFPTGPGLINNYLIYQVLFLLVFLIYYMANPLLFPAINFLLKNSYSHANFSRLYGYSSTANKIMMLVSTSIFGYMLDIDNFSFTYFYPVSSLLSIISIFILTKIPIHENYTPSEKKPIRKAIADAFKNSSKILKTNKPYRDFEIAFGLYGWAWLSTVAVITIFFSNILDLNYTSVAFYKNAYNTLAILILPFFGKLLGKIDPRKFAIYTFASMFFHLFFMALTQYINNYIVIWEIKIYYSLIASYLSYGFFAAMMALLWYIGSAYFCRNEEVGSYQAIHLTLTGVRGMLAPLIGVFLYELIGFPGVFGLALVSLAMAMWVMKNSMRKYPIRID